MPIYEYQCGACNTKFELSRAVTEALQPATCPSGHEGARKLFSAFMTFSKGANGVLTAVSGGGGGCSSCGDHNCSSCGSSL